MKEKLKKNKIPIVIIIGIMLIGGIFWGFYKASQSQQDEIAQGTISYNSNFKSNAPGNLVFPAYTQNIEVKRNSKELPIVLANPKVNKNVFFKYEFSIVDSKNKKKIVIGSTKLIASGRALNEVKLQHMEKVEKGEQKLRIDVYAYVFNKQDGKNVKSKLNQAYWDVILKVL